MTVSPWMNAGISAFLLSFIGMSTGGILTSSVFKLSSYMSARLVMVNLPIGLALGAGLQGAQLQSMHEHLMMAMIIHSIPEGLAVGLLLVAAGYRLSFLFSTFILINAPILIGSAIGNSLNKILDSSTISLFISVAIGTLVFVIIHEMFYRINS